MLLLSCCAPCSIGVIFDLHQKGTDFTVLFYNPNIRPLAEYERRRDENRRICQQLGVPFVELPYEPQVWEKATQGLEAEPERGSRCSICFRLRLLRAAQYAKENGYTCFSSVLGFSRWKDLDQVNHEAQDVALQEHIPYDMTNWRKDGRTEEACRLAKEYRLYRQNYCGCHPRGENNRSTSA